LTGGIEYLFKKNKVDYLKGTGKFASRNEIDIDLIAGGTERIIAKNTIIATGSEPTPIPSIPADEKYIVTSTGALSLTSIPKRMIVVGSGVIGLELGSVYSRLGTEVSVLGNMDRICPFLDSDLSVALKKTLEKQGIKFVLKTRVNAGRRG
jgi:dihydrolipoamide dehydrogenase